MTELFDDPKPAAPLAEMLRPERVEDVVGQGHLLGEDKPLRVAFESGKPHSKTDVRAALSKCQMAVW